MILTGREVVIVGGSSGIGLATAEAALAKGARVVLVSRSPEKLAKAEAHLKGGERVRTFAADATNESAIERVFAEIPAFDHLVVTAVEGRYVPIKNMTAEIARSLFDSKLVAALLLAKHAAPRLRPGGSITLTSGAAADRPGPNGTLIASANGALFAMVRAMALELAPLRVNTVSPGWVDTPFWDTFAGANKNNILSQHAQRLPVRKIGAPEDIAHAIVFLMENTFTTGTVLQVDGGHRLI